MIRILMYMTVIGAGVVSWLVMPHITSSATASVNYRLFWIEGGPGKKGDYVNFEKQHPLLKDGTPKKLTKRIVCMEGELLTFDGRRHTCGDAVLGSVLDRTHEGKPLDAFVWNGPVPAGKVFVEGDHERSFDSRYFGFVDRSATTRLRGIW
jgi:conjugal transfer pilin signal peptidase TrbI